MKQRFSPPPAPSKSKNYREEKTPCVNCGLRMVKSHREPRNGGRGLCAYCERVADRNAH